MLPTPSTSHVDSARVYEPAEDSFLLLDTLSSDSERAFLQRRFARHDAPSYTPLVTEVGVGSGVVLAFVTAHSQLILGRSDVVTLGVDINPYACRDSVTTIAQACLNDEIVSGKAKAHALSSAVLRADLDSALRPGEADVLIFNPPYVPSESVSFPVTQGDQEPESTVLSASYEGGKDGMEVTSRLLDQLPEILSRRGVAYILLCQQNKPLLVIERIKSWDQGWEVSVVGRSGQQAGWEKLQVVRIARS